jgi:hypothetical protein
MKSSFKGFCFLAIVAALMVAHYTADHKQVGKCPYPSYFTKFTSIFMPDSANAGSACTACNDIVIFNGWGKCMQTCIQVLGSAQVREGVSGYCQVICNEARDAVKNNCGN